jgi:NAD(P)-dependent dehydrogenase (short-subunit alcohol dehydrogenase family)
MKDLAGKVAVVTGAGSGIGKGTATRFAAEGMKVVLADIEEKPLNAVRAELSDNGATVLAVPTDVAKGESMDALLERTLEQFGGVHLVHLNAGVAGGGLSWQLSELDWQWLLGVNLWGVIHGVRAFVPAMVERGEEGHIVMTGSMAGLTSSAFLGPYNVSKHGVVTLAETLAKELTATGSKIGVSVLCPGWVNTSIGESARNRPDELRNSGDGGMGDLGSGAIKPVIEAGMPPADVAEHVVAAVRDGRFYILTHPEWKPMIQTRLDDILAERAPTPTSFPTNLRQ